MKKIPLALSTVILAATGTGVFAASLPNEGTGVDMSVKNVLAANVARNEPDPNFLELTNQFDLRMTIDNVDLSTNRIGTTSSMLGEGNQTKRIIMVYRNYEDGVTEELADKRLRQLGEDDYSDWAVPLVNYDAKNTAPAWVKTLKVVDGHNLAENKTDMIYFAVEIAPMTNDNGQITWGEGYWLRGKADYRNCIHSSAYRENDEMYCLRKTVTDEDGMKWNKYVLNKRGEGAVTVPEDESIITWEEEWRQIQLERYETLTKQLETLDYNVRNATSLMDTTEDGLTKLDKTLRQMDGMETQVAGVSKAKATLTKLRTYYQNLLQSGSASELVNARAEIERLKGEIQNLTAANQALTEEKAAWENERADWEGKQAVWETERATLQADLGATRIELEAAKAEKAGLAQEKEDLQTEVARLKAELAQNNNCPGSTENGAGTNGTDTDETGPGGDKSDAGQGNNATVQPEQGDQDNARVETGDSSNQQPEVLGSGNPNTMTRTMQVGNSEVSKMERVEEQGSSQESTEENTKKMTNGQNLAENDRSEGAEVPNLGGKEPEFSGWWLLVPILMVIGSGVLWLKRHLAGQRRVN